MGFQAITTFANKCVERGLPIAYHLPLFVTARNIQEPAPVVTGLRPLEESKFEITFSPATTLNANNMPSGISLQGTDDLSSWREVQVLSGKTHSVIFSTEDPAGNIPDKAFYQLIKK